MAQKKYKVIAPRNLPTKYPVSFTILAILCLDFYNVPGWVCGSLGALLFILWVLIFIANRSQEEVDIMELFDDATINVLKERIEKRMQNNSEKSALSKAIEERNNNHQNKK